MKATSNILGQFIAYQLCKTIENTQKDLIIRFNKINDALGLISTKINLESKICLDSLAATMQEVLDALNKLKKIEEDGSRQNSEIARTITGRGTTTLRDMPGINIDNFLID